MFDVIPNSAGRIACFLEAGRELTGEPRLEVADIAQQLYRGEDGVVQSGQYSAQDLRLNPMEIVGKDSRACGPEVVGKGTHAASPP
ncbi:hypothetical protein NKH89_12265 [Mesorhizobium sp. M0923]|uniref:hypothetical protein n=1 Tax=unclassified Mesorhizobium TaxID=325217 RepID=UPI0003D032EF|nr:hypothetical protein [Mesorhizobium sp. L48C026A00]ESZ11304.1 hypothetical protein X737_30020 [Mesorhizobium sp. L48C026A00]